MKITLELLEKAPIDIKLKFINSGLVDLKIGKSIMLSDSHLYEDMKELIRLGIISGVEKLKYDDVDYYEETILKNNLIVSEKSPHNTSYYTYEDDITLVNTNGVITKYKDGELLSMAMNTKDKFGNYIWDENKYKYEYNTIDDITILTITDSSDYITIKEYDKLLRLISNCINDDVKHIYEYDGDSNNIIRQIIRKDTIETVYDYAYDSIGNLLSSTTNGVVNYSVLEVYDTKILTITV